MDVINYILSKKLKKYVDDSVGNVPDEKITEAVNTYLEENPVAPGATSEQAEQIQYNTNKLTELKEELANVQSAVSAKMDSYTIKTVMDSVATTHTQYYLGNQTAVDIVLPDSANVGQIITVCWYNGDTAATLSITGTMLDFDYAPGANSRSEINALWDGLNWAVLGNEMEVVADA